MDALTLQEWSPNAFLYLKKYIWLFMNTHDRILVQAVKIMFVLVCSGDFSRLQVILVSNMFTIANEKLVILLHIFEHVMKYLLKMGIHLLLL